ncbi:MAG: hypothetical protein MUC59_08380 [Saprospiraceae bacterium]|nr:hypothetical protein [Saprospiraceae bacterium]
MQQNGINQTWLVNQSAWIADYCESRRSYIYGLLPQTAVNLPITQTISILKNRLGEDVFQNSIDPTIVYNHRPPNPQSAVRESAIANLVGINVRTIQSFWNVVKYTLTIPASQSAIHLLPIWEPGVVSSLYGMASWNINPEFFSQELYEAFPHLDTVERQLKACVNLLHAMGKTVGMDVIPHTDRYSEIVLANPHYFEWLQRNGLQIVDHSANLHEKVQAAILDFLDKHGANGLQYPNEPSEFFGENFGEAKRILVLFGTQRDYQGRGERRAALMDFLFRQGYEPAPATMAPPYRGLMVDIRPEACTVDEAGREWRDYTIMQPTPESRVFGPLTRYKFYECLDDNEYWELDFDSPKKEVWQYFTEKYAQVAREYGFDFMRGDMSHVQPRAEGTPAQPGEFYDPLGAVKLRIQQDNPRFYYFAESFLAPANVLAYGDEVDHLEAAGAETTLGDLQSMVVGSPDFLQNFRLYLDIKDTRRVTPCFTMMTGDKDDPRFDKFYLGGNEARFFIGLFLPDMPSYMGLGFECRDVHVAPAPNEHYTKLYVFKIGTGPKATHGPYLWGKNEALFGNLLKIRAFAEQFLPKIENSKVRWLLPPDATGHKKLIAWTLEEKPEFVFVANLDIDNAAKNIKIPNPSEGRAAWQLLFSTKGKTEGGLVFNGVNLHLEGLEAGECRIYQCP